MVNTIALVISAGLNITLTFLGLCDDKGMVYYGHPDAVIDGVISFDTWA